MIAGRFAFHGLSEYLTWQKIKQLDVLIRRNPNDVQEWEKRVALWGEDDEKVWLSISASS